MVIREIEHFSIGQIADSGQCFRMRQIDESTYEVIANDRRITVRQQGRTCTFSCDREAFAFWEHYFDLSEDYGRYIGAIEETDQFLQRAAAFGSGIRILRQDLWEMLVTFLVTQMNNIKRIRRCIDNLCTRYGSLVTDGTNTPYYAFPTAAQLTGATVEDLMACNLGYRARYVREAARRVASGECDLDRIRHMSYPDAKKALLTFFGVGEKVAECICLFGLHMLSAFPVDTHIKKVLDRQYPAGFPKQIYAGYEGVLQQYIFHYDLKAESTLEML